MLYWFYWCLGVGLGLFLFDRLFLWFEEQGWMYWRKRKSSVSGVSAFLALDAAFNPGKKHVIEQIQNEKKEFAQEEDKHAA
jgi:hypothetical protein